jgi:prepilin signal peptidase PulO-like enzyme (type II secretory pathway)
MNHNKPHPILGLSLLLGIPIGFYIYDKITGRISENVFWLPLIRKMDWIFIHVLLVVFAASLIALVVALFNQYVRVKVLKELTGFAHANDRREKFEKSLKQATLEFHQSYGQKLGQLEEKINQLTKELGQRKLKHDDVSEAAMNNFM